MQAKVKIKAKTPKYEKLYVNLGCVIADRRVELDMFQIALAKKAGLSRASIGNIETGRHRIRLTDLVRIAESLGLDGPALLKMALDYKP